MLTNNEINIITNNEINIIKNHAQTIFEDYEKKNNKCQNEIAYKKNMLIFKYNNIDLNHFKIVYKDNLNENNLNENNLNENNLNDYNKLLCGLIINKYGIKHSLVRNIKLLHGFNEILLKPFDTYYSMINNKLDFIKDVTNHSNNYNKNYYYKD